METGFLFDQHFTSESKLYAPSMQALCFKNLPADIYPLQAKYTTLLPLKCLLKQINGKSSLLKNLQEIIQPSFVRV
jgi:hypothetical protein